MDIPDLIVAERIFSAFITVALILALCALIWNILRSPFWSVVNNTSAGDVAIEVERRKYNRRVNLSLNPRNTKERRTTKGK